MSNDNYDLSLDDDSDSDEFVLNTFGANPSMPASKNLQPLYNHYNHAGINMYPNNIYQPSKYQNSHSPYPSQYFFSSNTNSSSNTNKNTNSNLYSNSNSSWAF